LLGRALRGLRFDAQIASRAQRLRGAILDVFDTEPLAPDSPLWSHPKVVVTPHMATTPNFSVAVEQIAMNIQRLNAGLPPRNAVDPVLGY